VPLSGRRPQSGEPSVGTRPASFSTSSGYTVLPHYTRVEVGDVVYARDLGDPGEMPFTRGLHRSGYRGRLWTMRQFAGFGTPEETNTRYRALLAGGATGLSVAFDLPTLMGRDPDHALAAGEVGKCGVSIASLADMEVLFADIPIEDVTTSMTINAPAPMIFAMFLALAEARGIEWRRLSGTLQNDILTEFIAQKEFI
jgi:methylmalonyl-CoA mutase N-terminal domain/subunit